MSLSHTLVQEICTQKTTRPCYYWKVTTDIPLQAAMCQLNSHTPSWGAKIKHFLLCQGQNIQLNFIQRQRSISVHMCCSELQYQPLIIWGYHPLVFILPKTEINVFLDHPIVLVLWGRCVCGCVCVRVRLYLVTMTSLRLTQRPNKVTYTSVLPRNWPGMIVTM